MHFGIFHGIPTLAGNALLAGDRQATLRQTPREHADLLDVTNLPNYQLLMRTNPAAVAMMMPALEAEAQAREAAYAKYWDDQLPRRQISQSSSWVGDFDYDPVTKNLEVQMGQKIYSFPGMEPDQVARWINSSSIGSYFNQNLKGKWG